MRPWAASSPCPSGTPGGRPPGTIAAKKPAPRREDRPAPLPVRRIEADEHVVDDAGRAGLDLDRLHPAVFRQVRLHRRRSGRGRRPRRESASALSNASTEVRRAHLPRVERQRRGGFRAPSTRRPRGRRRRASRAASCFSSAFSRRSLLKAPSAPGRVPGRHAVLLDDLAHRRRCATRRRRRRPSSKGAPAVAAVAAGAPLGGRSPRRRAPTSSTSRRRARAWART